MPLSIDRFSTLLGAVLVSGWSSAFEPGTEVTILRNGEPMRTITYPVLRPDVAAHHGAEAEHWGFRAYALPEDGRVLASEIGLAIGTGETIERLAGFAHRPTDDPSPGQLWGEFVDEINAAGGRVLEIGARARSGITRRELFGDTVRYVGLDVAPGPNVDIVCDAHELSTVITEPFDFVFSMSTFEHFLMPWKVAIEIGKVLRVGGKVFSHSHQTWPEHDVPWDYFRFSRDAWAGLFNRHTGFGHLHARHGDRVTVVRQYNDGGSYDEMEFSPGHAMTVCVAEKIAEPMVEWNARVGDLQDIVYAF